VDLKNLLKAEFALACHLHLSPTSIEGLDFQEVKFIIESLHKKLEEENNRLNRK
jgi:hypothetical protein